MARTQNLPIYSASFSFVREIYRMRARLPKSLKHDLGQEIFHSGIKILKYIVQANRAQEKNSYILQALLEIEVQWALLRLLYELRGITEGEFKVFSTRLEEIGKQAEAWLKWQKKRSKT